MILPLTLLLLLLQQQQLMMMRRRRRTKRTLPPRVALALYTTSPPMFFPPPGILVFGFSGFLTVAHPASDELVIFSSIPCQTLVRAGGEESKSLKRPFSNKPKVPLRGAGGLHHAESYLFSKEKTLVRSPFTHVTTATKMQQLLVLLESSNPPTKGLRLRPYALDLRP